MHLFILDSAFALFGYVALPLVIGSLLAFRNGLTLALFIPLVIRAFWWYTIGHREHDEFVAQGAVCLGTLGGISLTFASSKDGQLPPFQTNLCRLLIGTAFLCGCLGSVTRILGPADLVAGVALGVGAACLQYAWKDSLVGAFAWLIASVVACAAALGLALLCNSEVPLVAASIVVFSYPINHSVRAVAYVGRLLEEAIRGNQPST